MKNASPIEPKRRPHSSQPTILSPLFTAISPPVPARVVRRLGGLLRGGRHVCRFYSLGIDHRAVEFDDDRIDVVDTVVDLHGFFRSQHEGSLGQAVGTSGVWPDDRRAAHLAR